MRFHCRRKPDGLYVAQSDLGDVFEFEMRVNRDAATLRLASPPQWRTKPCPPDAPPSPPPPGAAVRERARSDGFRF